MPAPLPTPTTQSVRGRRVLVRVDCNVPFRPDGTIADDARIAAIVPTVRALLRRGAVVVLMSHLGRPGAGGKEDQASLAPVAERLGKLLGCSVPLLSGSTGDAVEQDVLALAPGSVVMLENLRFDPGETKNDPTFAKRLARLGDMYVNDAFSVSHRAHASVAAITKFLPSVAGPLLATEVEALTKALRTPQQPLVLIVGGAKIETKLPIIAAFLPKAAAVLVGGAVANDFFAAKGYDIQASKYDPEFVGAARKFLKNPKVLLPVDVVTSPNPHGKGRIKFRPAGDVGPGEMILDIGQETVRVFNDIIARAKTIVWNGPMGLLEIPAFAHGTEAIAKAIAKNRHFTVVGGGETGSALKDLDLEQKYSHVSMGGGAMLEFLGGKKLPGLEALGYYRTTRTKTPMRSKTRTLKKKAPKRRR